MNELIKDMLHGDIKNEVTITTKVTKEEKESIKKAMTNEKSAKNLIRFFVDQYEQAQDYRVTAQNQMRSLIQGFDESDEEQLIFIEKMLEKASAQESVNKKYMDIATKDIPVCRWMKSIMGIGPVHAAYIYSSFKVSKDRYATDFLSYAGLNDNNNPWLGASKAEEIVSGAIVYREEKFENITNTLQSISDKTQFKNIKSELTKLGKEDYFELDDIKSVIKDNIQDFDIECSDIDLSIISDYVRWLAYPKICDDILIDYVSSAVGRKFSNVKKGTINNWTGKKSKTKYPSSSDLTSYLAKPPYNKDLKTRMFLIGKSFVKVCNKEKSLYGKIYKNKKLEYIRKNDNGEYAERAKEILESKNFSKDNVTRKALLEGKLSPGHIDAMARRYAVKLFVSHVYEAMYYAEYHEEPPQTYVIAILGHHNYIAPEIDYRPYIDGEL